MMDCDFRGWIAGCVLVAGCGLAVLDLDVAPGSMLSRRSLAETSRVAPRYLLSNAPLRFERNEGQSAQEVDFLTRGSGYAVFLGKQEAVLSLRGSAAKDTVRIQLAESNAESRAEGFDPLPGKTHYLLGSDPGNWRRGITAFERVRYQAVYPGIDLVYHGRGRQLEYDFVVAPGADPAAIRLRLAGARNVAIAANGDLAIAMSAGVLRQHKPVVYQETERGRVEIPGGYTLLSGNTAGFAVGEYDPSRPLVIDPIVSYSTYLGGSADDVANAVAVDGSGNAYVTGLTESSNFPGTPTVFQDDPPGGEDVFVTKFNPDGTDVLFSTYLGGSSDDIGNGIAVDGSGFVYVTGLTRSGNFPTRNAPVQNFQGGDSDCFVTKLNPDGSDTVFSTYLGTSQEDRCSAIAVDSDFGAVVAGVTRSSSFPKTPGVVQSARSGGEEGFVTKYSPAGDAVAFSLVLGGGGDDGAEAMALDAEGNVYVTGYTGSDRFPVTGNALQPERRGGRDVFVTKLSSDGGSLLYSTFLGGNNDDTGRGIALDSEGGIYVAGISESGNFPTSASAFQRLRFPGASSDAFVTKYDAQGQGIYSTYIGGEGGDSANGIVVDSQGLATVTGVTRSFAFPTAQTLYGGGPTDAYITQLNSRGTGLLDSEYLGAGGEDEGKGVAIDPQGRVYVTGFTRSDLFPITEGAFRNTRSGSEAFVIKIGVSTFTTVSAAAPGQPTLGIAPASLASGFGAGWSVNAGAEPGQPLPPELDGVRVQIIDSAAFGFNAPLLAVASQPQQINFLTPADAALGTALMEVTVDGVVVSRGIVEIRRVAPAIFTANASGEGVPAAYTLRVRGDGSVTEEFVFSDAPLGSRMPVPIDLGPETDQVFLILFGTGIRGAGGVRVAVGDREITQGIFFGAQPQFAGLDQVNVPLPRTLLGAGLVNVVLIADDQTSNTVQVFIQ